jgi:methylase of polypeptide subunit release factors
MIEIGHTQAAQVMEQVQAVGGYTNPAILKDLAGKDRVAAASLR